ncbi:biotin/lipoyl-containing protein [Floccifex sp.]|uniref:biotin/lipoyl-containing protein n=1 Tax=Floccifex sp. TaxID=2815810 RepID=UPI002A75F3C9|nr:biotin/lipoyl-containing protein [Floccifex sp.]MDD7281754.1 biotin/lipoyl-binding protein [Erysipelotrichaceae bacterium]MDY2959004.1 biotin/lipoyl-containing protein [Floccifex sp.]
MKYVITLNGKQYEVEVEQGQATANYVGEVSQQPVVQPQQTAPQQAPVTQQHPVAVGAGEPVKAPMPGTILQVNVSNGQKVKAGDILFVLEAMKMENEIVAPTDGTITSVVVSKGASVQTDDVLATLQ